MHKWQISWIVNFSIKNLLCWKKDDLVLDIRTCILGNPRCVVTQNWVFFSNRDRIAIKLLSWSWWPLIAMFCFPIITRTPVIHLRLILFSLTCSALWEWSCRQMLGAPPHCVCRNASPRVTAVWWALFSQTCFFTSLEILDQSRVRKERSWPAWVMNNKQ